MECPYCNKIFKNWLSVRGHLPSCDRKTGEYFIDLNEGAIHYLEFPRTFKELKVKFPNLKSNIADIKRNFKLNNIILNINRQNFSKEEIISKIKDFYNKEKRIPCCRDWDNKYSLPNTKHVQLVFGTWNNAIEEAGFTPNYNDGFGVRTKADDGILYRSSYEVYFVNKFLYNKELYIYELKYPYPYNKYYDFYLPEKNLYIEIDGGIRPHVIEEKIKINKLLNRNLLIIPTKDLKKLQKI